MTLFDREPLFEMLETRGHTGWAASLRPLCRQRFTPETHGTLPRWIRAWQQLPECADAGVEGRSDAVTVRGSLPDDARSSLRDTLMEFHPWRKGPFDFFGVAIDTEWRSDLKWNRLATAVDFRRKTVLDIGCGNGYYGWRMLAAGADFVVGCDPFLLYVLQFEAVRRYVRAPERHFVVPVADVEIPAALEFFDIAVSMGVLYHRTSPIDHLQLLWQSLKPGGELVLETLIVESAAETVLMPEDRYAKMRNVWFVPSIAMLRRWLLRTGFRDIAVVDISRTTREEQRRTDWMTFESLADFLDPGDPRRTVERHPAPVRALLTARRP